MANKATVRVGLDTLIAENWSDAVIDTMSDAMPLMQVLFGRNGTKKGPWGLGMIDAGVVTSGMKMAKARSKQILSSLVYQPFIKNLLPSESDGKVVGRADNMPSRSNWEENSPVKRFARPSVKWCEIADPCEVPNKDLRITKKAAEQERAGWKPIGDLLKVENTDVLAVHTKRWNQLLWGTYTGTKASTTGAPSDEDQLEWDAIHSIPTALKTDNLYCGVDRTLAANAYWRGNYVTATTAPVFRNMIRYANYGAPGLAKKGGGIDMIVVGGDLFSIALAEADAKSGTVIHSGTPIQEFGQFGFKRDMVRIDNTWILYDPECPSAKAAGLNLDTWTVAIHPDANFRQTEPFDQSKIKGGDDSHAWTLRTQLMVVCEVPSWNIWWNDVQ